MEQIKKIKLFLFDMDGTLYLGNRLFPFTKELLKTIRETGRDYLFTTNNSSKSTKDYVKKLEGMGISCTEEDFFTSAQATIDYLNQNFKDKTLYVCGTDSFKKELIKAGFTLTEKTEETQCIVMGFDTELNFKKLEDISYLLCKNPDLPYLATNPDLVCPTEFGSVPDCGSVCQMIYNVCGKKPVVIGKPDKRMMELARLKKGVSKEECAVVGDRIYTDIKSGLNAGILSILVMSGETTEEILSASPEKPHLVLKDAEEILNIIKE